MSNIRYCRFMRKQLDNGYTAGCAKTPSQIQKPIPGSGRKVEGCTTDENITSSIKNEMIRLKYPTARLITVTNTGPPHTSLNPPWGNNYHCL